MSHQSRRLARDLRLLAAEARTHGLPSLPMLDGDFDAVDDFVSDVLHTRFKRFFRHKPEVRRAAKRVRNLMTRHSDEELRLMLKLATKEESFG